MAVEPRYNEGRRACQNNSAITKFRYIEFPCPNILLFLDLYRGFTVPLRQQYFHNHGITYFICSSNFWVCGQNPVLLPFKWNRSFWAKLLHGAVIYFPALWIFQKKKFCEIFTFLTIGVKRINKGSAFLAQNIETRTGFLIYKLRSSSFEQ